MTRAVVCGLMLTWFCAASRAADEPVFSGPQVGEKLPSFTIQGVLGDEAGKKIDLIARADGKPVLIVFVHQRTRPAFGLTNAVMRFAATRSKQGLVTGVCFLTDDATATENWVKRVSQNLVKGATHGISADGLEGPGAYGLNRNVALTVLVGKEGKVTANFALVQPGMKADGPKILAAIVEATGGGKVPPIEQFSGRRYAGKNKPRDEVPNLRPLLSPVIDKSATPEQVDKAAAAVEEFIAKNEAARKEVGRIARTIVNSGKLENYGTSRAQEYLRKWAKKYGSE